MRWPWQKTPSTITGERIELALNGLHCTNCSLNIDATLEDIPGVLSARTNYAQQRCVVQFDPTTVQTSTLTAAITSLGYQVVDSQEK